VFPALDEDRPLREPRDLDVHGKAAGRESQGVAAGRDAGEPEPSRLVRARVAAHPTRGELEAHPRERLPAPAEDAPRDRRALAEAELGALVLARLARDDLDEDRHAVAEESFELVLPRREAREAVRPVRARLGVRVRDRERSLEPEHGPGEVRVER